MKHNITSDTFLAAAKKAPVKAPCGTEFSLDVTNSIVVADCGSFTDQEQQHMMDGLLFKWRRDAASVCAQNGDSCPNAIAVNFSPKSQSCVKGSDGKNVWTILATVVGKCNPI